MLVNKLKELYFVKNIKTSIILLWFTAMLLCLKLIHKNT